MKLPPEHELLSAYLDGELDAAERARVEQLLADSPAARRVLEELKSVSLTVQGLPELRLAEDLTDRILRRAEQAILSGQVGPANEPEPSAPPETGLFRRLLLRAVTSRGVAWSGAALAIALLIMLSGPREHQRDVAVAPEMHPQEGEAPAAAPVSGELWSADSQRNGLSKSAVDDLNAAAPRDRSAVSDLSHDRMAEPSAVPMPAAVPTPAAAPMPAAVLQRGSSPADSPQPAD
ncbi:MAG: zf-HC2 domain-containing protein, partial [Patescibacteria group bacterium]|nr:zf-HC2 domain-containing protein [Patescibacteria group bacterium]